MLSNCKYLVYTQIVFFVFFCSCKSLNEEDINNEISDYTKKKDIVISPQILNLSQQISTKALKENIKILSHDSMKGRMTGSIGQKKAAKFIKELYIKESISSPQGKGYYQIIPREYFKRELEDASENVVAYIEGTKLKDEVIVISAHYDHLGVNTKGEVFNGADDNGSGTAALIELAKLFQKAKNDGYGSKRSILFLHVTGEEIGLYGSKYYVENAFFPLSKTITNLNVDMIGRVDDKYANAPEYLYLVGSDKLSQELHDINESINASYVGLKLDYKFNSPDDPLRIFYRSDHFNFAKNDIPVIFFFSGLHKDYHKITDTFDKIEFDLIKKRSQLIFLTAWELANMPSRVTINRSN